MTPVRTNPPSKAPRSHAQTLGTGQRRHHRSQEHSGQDLIVRSLDKAGGCPLLVAKLWDFSYGGIGLDISQQLAVGQEIEMAADLLSDNYSLGFEARGRVVHCRSIGKDHYRVGVAFLDVQYRRIEPGSSQPSSSSKT